MTRLRFLAALNRKRLRFDALPTPAIAGLRMEKTCQRYEDDVWQKGIHVARRHPDDPGSFCRSDTFRINPERRPVGIPDDIYERYIK